MSILVTQAVWATKGISPVEKLVLLSLADHADDTGGNSFPSVETIRDQTGLGIRSVQRSLRNLESNGLIIEAAANAGRRSRTYQINLSIPASVTPLPIRKGATETPRQSDAPPDRRAIPATVARRGATETLYPATVAPDPSLTVIEPSVKRPRQKRVFEPITEEFLVAQQEANPSVDVRDILARAKNRTTWEGYHDKRGALIDRIGWALEKKEKANVAPRTLWPSNGASNGIGGFAEELAELRKRPNHRVFS